jgi:hypothetical protein
MNDQAMAAAMTLRDTIIPKSDQLNFDDFLAGPIDVKVTGMAKGSLEQPVIVKVVNAATGAEMRPYKPSKGMRRVLITVWGDKGAAWIGKCMRLYGDPTVKFGGVAVGGIQVSHVSGISQRVNVRLTVSRAKRIEYAVDPLGETTTATEGAK